MSVPTSALIARQTPPGQPIPSAVGQWAGPYQLTQITDEHPNVPLSEIVHAVVLPDAEGSVLFWCRQYSLNFDLIAHGGLAGPTHTFVWHPSDPQRVFKNDVPNAANGTEDVFCGGHQFLPGGDVLTFGGTNLQQIHTTGHGAAFRFDVASNWDDATSNWTAAGSMRRERWYPNGFLAPDGTMLVLGHDKSPIYGSPELETEYMQDRFSSGTATWTGGALSNVLLRNANVLDTSGVTCTAANNYVFVHDYPRTHLLGFAQRLRYMALVDDPVIGVRKDWHLALTSPCPGAPPAPIERWTEQPGLAPSEHREGSTGHFVLLDGATGVEDYVFVAAGDERTANGFVAQNEVEVYVDRLGTAAWDASVPDLNQARVNQNMVILADGSLLVVGGNDFPPPQSTAQGPAYRKPERFIPSFLGFSGQPTSWTYMAEQGHERRYHSVAGLLPDGRVFSAGGDFSSLDPNDPNQSHHTVEIFSPPYLFKGPRPVISGLSSTVWSAGDPNPILFTLTFRPGSGPKHVALIKTGSITHAFDASQRYVRLDHDAQSMGNDTYSVFVQIPSDKYQVPAGHYFLVAVSTLGVPSVGTMIEIQ
ncbi:MAG: DUF1929 domain-containing protein [Planctomycetes bacterium]|nr:DUF1929 domain-containing protein [Planctomycetota bacterium]